MEEYLSNINLSLYLLTFGISISVSFALTPILRYIAIRLKILDHPHSNIKTHVVATPYLGGMAIWAGWIISLVAIRYFTHFPTGTLHSLRGILVGSLFVLSLGLIDDILPRGLGFRKKFLFQAVAAVIVILFDVRIHFISPYPLAVAFSIFWVVGITNAFNIVDIMDGLSSGIAVIASFAFLLIALPTEQLYVNFCSVALAGACLGFLPFNLSKSNKIFMGDTGSLTIGFILASISMGTSYTKANEIAMLAPLLILAIPIYDTILVMYLRWKRGISPFLGSKDHFAIRLKILGFSRIQILLITYFSSALLAFGAFLVARLSLYSAALVFIFLLTILLITAYRLGKVNIE